MEHSSSRVLTRIVYPAYTAKVMDNGKNVMLTCPTTRLLFCIAAAVDPGAKDERTLQLQLPNKCRSR
jgi:hypothetical protein